MHLLAHAFCAGQDGMLQAGQIAGDYVRGRDLSAYPDRLADGIRQHRALDAFTDQHASARLSRNRLSGPWRRYAGVLVDLAYGHLLARQWDSLGDSSLSAFEAAVHRSLAQHHAVLPLRLQQTRERLLQYRVLSGIGDADGIAVACERLSHRLPGLAGGDKVVNLEMDGLAGDFTVFWPDLLVRRDALLAD